MELYGQQNKSIPQKVIIQVVEFLLLWISFWVLFQTGGSWVQTHLGITNAAAGGEHRRQVIFAFNLIIFLRLSYTMIFLLKRKIPWEESFSVPMAFALYYLGYSLLVLPTSAPLDGWDALGVFLFLFGCILNTGGEILRDNWKKDPAHHGMIYTEGFFRYARHINYFGDLLWVSGYAILSGNWYSVGIPVFLFCFFAFYNAPKLDQYLKKKYGKDYDAYAAKTKMLIPFVY